MPSSKQSTSLLDRLGPADAESIERYLHEDLQRFERSNMDGQLARANLYSAGSQPCPRCYKKGERRSIGIICVRVAACHTCKGSGVVIEVQRFGEYSALLERRQPVEREVKRRCWNCDGCGVEELKAQSRRPGAFTVPTLCTLCAGACSIPAGGFIRTPDDELTAKSTGSGVSFVPPDPDDTALTRYGLVTRRLMRLDDHHARVLYAVHGPGLGYKSDPGLGQLWPVLPLTPAGRLLAHRYRRRCPQHFRDRELVEGLTSHDEWWDQLTQPELLRWVKMLPDTDSRQRRQDLKMIKVGKLRAALMYRAACRAWNLAGSDLRGEVGSIRRSAAQTTKQWAALEQQLVTVEGPVRSKSNQRQVLDVKQRMARKLIEVRIAS